MSATIYWADRPHKFWQVKATTAEGTEVIAVITAEDDDEIKNAIVDALNARAACGISAPVVIIPEMRAAS